jgi:AcrR family transcriptional regulator
MSRPADPEIKTDLLVRCLQVVMTKGTFNISIHELAKLAGTSARILIYHFGSKDELDERLIDFLDASLRERFFSLLSKHQDRKGSISQMWGTIIEDAEILNLTLLYASINYKSLQSKTMRKTMEKQTMAWVEILRPHVRSDEDAEVLYTLILGAMVDVLITGNKDRGRRSLNTILKNIGNN